MIMIIIIVIIIIHKYNSELMISIHSPSHANNSYINLPYLIYN